MKSRMGRAALIAVEAAGILVAVMVACAAFLMWRVHSGPVGLDPFIPAARAAGNAAIFNGSIRRIEAMTFSQVAEGGGYRLTLENVHLGLKKAQASGLLPLVDLVFEPKDLLSGKIGPRRILIDGAALRVVRRSDRKLRVDFGEATQERARVFELLTGGAYFREAFERAQLRNATITFSDMTSGRSWTASGGEGDIRRIDAGYEVAVTAAFQFEGRTSNLAFGARYDLATEVLSSEVTLDRAPVGDLVAMLFNHKGDFLTSPVSGRASIDIGRNGEILSSFISGRAEAGALTIGGRSIGVDWIETAAGFDPFRKEFDVQRLAWASAAGDGALAGRVTLSMSPQGAAVSAVGFSLHAGAITLAPDGAFEAPLLLDKMSATGDYDVDKKKFSVSALEASFLGVALGGELQIESAGEAQSPAVEAALTIAGTLPPQKLLQAWPKAMATGARDFVADRIPAAAFSDVAFNLTAPAGAVPAGGRLPDEAMSLAFRVADATIIYAPGMTPLTKVSGRGVLRGNSFRFDADRGAVGRIALESGEVEIPALAPKGQPAYFRLKARGDAGDMLAVLNQEPLAVLKDGELTPQQFSGPARVDVEITRPNLRVAAREDYRYEGVATFTNLSVDSLIGDVALTDGVGKLRLSTETMTVAGKAMIADAPVAVEWRQRFFGAGDKAQIRISGEADSSTGDFFGIPTRRYVQGPVAFEAKATGNLGDIRVLDVTANFTRAALTSERLGWMKPQGLAAKGSARVNFTPDGVSIAELRIDGESATIAGAVDFDAEGRLVAAEIPEFKLAGAADLSLFASRNAAGMLSTTLTGSYLNAAALVEEFVEHGTFGQAVRPDDPGSTLTARIEKLNMRRGEIFGDASLDFRTAAGRLEALSLSAMGESRRPISVSLKTTGDEGGRRQSVEARSGDIGALFAGVFGMTSVKGGEGVLEFLFTAGEDGAENSAKGPVGVLQARNLRIVEAPLLARIFAAGSLTGLANLMNGQGIEIADAYASFTVEDGAVLVNEARAAGPSVGLTAQGRFNLGGDHAVNLSGAVAPAYGVNSLLGKTPLIGDIFVNREGEGLLALSYQVAGPAAEPRVTVNPLSALAPGVFRRMFEGGRAAPTAPNETPPQPAEPAIR